LWFGYGIPSCSYSKCFQVILTTLLKVYVRGGLFEKSRDLLSELETMGYADEEVHYFLWLCIIIIIDCQPWDTIFFGKYAS
jgi:pentatricopeptide repeat protein